LTRGGGRGSLLYFEDQLMKSCVRGKRERERELEMTLTCPCVAFSFRCFHIPTSADFALLPVKLQCSVNGICVCKRALPCQNKDVPVNNTGFFAFTTTTAPNGGIPRLADTQVLLYTFLASPDCFSHLLGANQQIPVLDKPPSTSTASRNNKAAKFLSQKPRKKIKRDDGSNG
jgi:hypothetical protein